MCVHGGRSATEGAPSGDFCELSQNRRQEWALEASCSLLRQTGSQCWEILRAAFFCRSRSLGSRGMCGIRALRSERQGASGLWDPVLLSEAVSLHHSPCLCCVSVGLRPDTLVAEHSCG